jgi:hypothetical protein
LCLEQNNHKKIKNPLLHIDDLLDQFNGAMYFNQINIKSRYYQIDIANKDIEETTMKTKYGSYEVLMINLGYVMPCHVHNHDELIFYEKLDVFMIIYIDDILVYSKIAKVHMEHLECVLSKFQQNKLFANRAKCEFAQ